ncbi:hypothetical protein BF49_4610 [Bradyrhizobium sp.]|nr:hypothetical protein BF49_4610 [Bradyrhizobium sp.]
MPFDADGGKRFEDVDEAAAFRGRISTRDGVSSREDGYGTSGSRVIFGVHAQAPRFACCAELGPKSRGESACPRAITIRELSRTFQDRGSGALSLTLAPSAQTRRSRTDPPIRMRLVNP